MLSERCKVVPSPQLHVNPPLSPPRQVPRPGVLAVDIAYLSRSGPYVLTGVSQSPGRTYAQKLRSMAAKDAREALPGILADARMRGNAVAVRSDRESGIEAAEDALLNLGVRLKPTQGRTRRRTDVRRVR